jgi:hypothetical protein
MDSQNGFQGARAPCGLCQGCANWIRLRKGGVCAADAHPLAGTSTCEHYVKEFRRPFDRRRVPRGPDRRGA